MRSNGTLEIPAIKIIQQGYKIYLGKMLGSEILEWCITTEWDPDLEWDLEKQGYQRKPNEKHYKRIGEFLKQENDPLLPTSALLSARETDYGILSFKTHNDNQSDIGQLFIPKGRNIFIVDYQHRWRGLKFAVESLKCKKLTDFQIPVIILADVPRYEEIRQFYLINSKQKRVDTDLGLALLQTMAPQASEDELANFVGPGKKYRIRATRLVFKLASMKQGPWIGKIIDPNMVASGNQIVSIKSFVDSLQPILSKRSPIHSKEDDEIVKIIIDLWSAIEKLLPNVFSKPKDYSLQRTVGVFVMHRVAAKKVFKECMSKKDISVNSMKQVLEKTKDKYLNESFWKVGGPVGTYSSAAGHKKLADLIIEDI